MKIAVKTVTGTVEHEGHGFTLQAITNEHGDLTIYRSHTNMLETQSVACYAEGEWLKSKVIYDDEEKSR